MSIPPSQICFGLTSELDKKSFACFLQLAGNPALAETLAQRLSSEEIENVVDMLTSLMQKHLTKQEYHQLFLLDNHHHD